MSFNAALNAVLALIEGRPEVAREVFRSPELRADNTGQIQARIFLSLEKIQVQAQLRVLRLALTDTLRVQPPLGADDEYVKDFLEGVTQVEDMLAKRIRELEGQLALI